LQRHALHVIVGIACPADRLPSIPDRTPHARGAGIDSYRDKASAAKDGPFSTPDLTIRPERF
jgi:hypothetical protein